MDIFTALADLTRREIIEMLASKGKLSATEIYNSFSASPPAISQHLKILLEFKLVKMEKRAQQRIYELNRDGLNEITIWTQKLSNLWNERFNTLDHLLEIEKKKELKIKNETLLGKKEKENGK